VGKLALTLEIVKRTDGMTGFVVFPRRWVAEHTFAWLMNSRRLARDYETFRPAAGGDPVVDGHPDKPASGTATGFRPTLNIPHASRRSHPRSARRLALERTPSTFAGAVPKPSSTAISLAFTGP
jgi:transposase